MTKTTLLAAIAALGLVAAPAVAQETAAPAAQPAMKPATEQKAGGDAQQMIQKLFHKNKTEAEFGRQAAQKATNERVKQFGQRLAQDYEKAATQLQQIATSQQITLDEANKPQEMKDMQQKFQNLSGEGFDKKFVEEMIKAHQKAISKLEKKSDMPDNQELSSFIQQTLPTLREHLQQAQDLARELNIEVKEDPASHESKSETRSGTTEQSEKPQPNM